MVSIIKPSIRRFQILLVPSIITNHSFNLYNMVNLFFLNPFLVPTNKGPRCVKYKNQTQERGHK